MDHDLEKSRILYDILYAVFRRKVALTILCALSFLLVVLFAFFTKPTYKATTKILIRPNPQQQLILFKDLATPSRDVQAVNPARNLIQILTGREMAREVVERFELDKRIQAEQEESGNLLSQIMEIVSKSFNLVKMLVVPEKSVDETARKDYVAEAMDRLMKKAEDIILQEGSHVINLSIWADTPKLASDMANFMAQRLMEKSSELGQIDATRAYDFTKEQITAAEIALRESESAVLQFRETNGIISLAEQKTSRLRELDRLETERIAAKTEFSEAKAKLKELRTAILAQQKLVSASPMFADHPEMDELVANLNKAEVELVGVLEKFTEENEIVRTLRRKIAEIRDKIGRALEGVMQSDSAILASIHPDMPKEYSKLTSDIAALAAKQETVEGAIQVLEEETFFLSKMEVELERLNRHRQTNENLYTNLLDKYSQLEVQKAFQMSGYDVQIIDKAFLSDGARPDRPKWSLVIPFGFIGSLLLSFVMVFVVEYWDESFKRPQDVEQKLGLDVLCTVPNMR